jgi:hypothetical protein
VGVLAGLAGSAMLMATPAQIASAAVEKECFTASNPVSCENSKTGSPRSEWEVERSGDPTIQGYATAMSVNVGQTESFKINTPASSYHLNIYRLGYYGGDGARLVASNITPTASLPQAQPACLTYSSTGLIDCGNWGVSASWAVPSNAVSGVYVADLVRNDTGGESQIPFVVRNDASHSEILLQTSDATWEAYNAYGGNSLYTCTVSCPAGEPEAYKAAYAVSYNRPFDGSFTTDNGYSYLYYAEYQMMYWLEQQGYNVSYTSESEVASNGALLKNHKVFMSSGHDEYWSASQRSSVESALAAGVNLAFFSGNEVFWKTRWAPSTEGSNTANRTLITYKETHFNSPVDPEDPPTWTGSWRDPRFSPPADGAKPENSLTGQFFLINSGSSELTVPYQYSKLRLWRNTAATKLTSGKELTLAPGTDTLGYEWDEDLDNGFRPAGEFDASSTTVSGTEAFRDYGSNVATGTTATHHLTLYKAPSGALVFGAGTVQWSWGLANINAWEAPSTEPSENAPDPNMEQATVNLLADMGAQPGTLSSGLVAATKSTDTTPPTSTITSPASGAGLADGSAVTIAGTATDTGGGVVAGVEVSTDGGSTWHPATLTTAAGASVSWSYAWVATGNPTTTIESRAVDDSGNLQTSSSITGTAKTVSVSCPCSIWGATTPATPDSGDGLSTEVGVKFTSASYGTVTGIRFYKAAANTGTHIGSLWTASGTLLAQATFTSETASGWQQVNFATPVAISPNTTYVAAYLAPNGHYSATEGYFYSPPPTGGHVLSSPPLSAVPASATTTNGLYAYTSTSGFPTSTFQGTNYWVDVAFTPAAAPGMVTGVTATASNASANVSWTAPSTGGQATTYTVTAYASGSTTAAASVAVTGAPPATSTVFSGLTAGTSYTFKVQASNPNGTGSLSAASNAVTPTPAAAPGAPTAVSALPATHEAVVSWSAPANNGGSAITSYTVTPYIGGTAQTPVTVGGSATTTTVTGLANGSAFTFTVAAANALGTGAASVASAAVTPGDTIFDFAKPTVVDSGEITPIELGVKFTSSAFGSVTGIRFFKSEANTGTHIGSLWTAAGVLLAEATFTSESPSGWQQVYFSKPVEVTPGTTYVAGYLAPSGHFSVSAGAFSSAPITNGPLQALATVNSANGLFSYTSTPAFPTSTFNGNNYFVDVLFAEAPPPGQVTNVTAASGPGSAVLSWAAPSSSAPITSYTITPYVGTTAQTPTTITGTPAAASGIVSGLKPGTAYTFTVQAASGSISGPVSAQSAAVTPGADAVPAQPTAVSAQPATEQALVSWTPPASNGGLPITGYIVRPYRGTVSQAQVSVPASATSATIKYLETGTPYTFKVAAVNAIGTGPESAASSPVTPASTLFDFAIPGTIDSGDANSTEVGVRFTSSVYGNVTGLRFYKAAANTGTHIGTLWTAGGTELAKATFTNETASGWQEVKFATPVAINEGATYVAAYLAPNGHYSYTAGAFASAFSNPPLQALASGTTANGLYSYSATSTFPTTASANADNYYVDVSFVETGLPPGVPKNVTAVAGYESAVVSWSTPNGGPVGTYVIVPYIGTTAQKAVAITGSPPATSATVSGLKPGTAYTFKVQAFSAIGTVGPSAASNAVTPLALTVPSEPLGVSATAATGQAQVSWSVPATNGGTPITGYTVTPYIGATAQNSVSVGPTATSATIPGLLNGTAYTFRVTATNVLGSGTASSSSPALTPLDTILDFATPATPDSGASAAAEVGITFTPATYGSATGIRFYKSQANTGTHVGSLWTATGTLLTSVTFTSETPSGWQQANFTEPVALVPGATYVAAYLAPNGHYSVTAGGLSSAITNGPLQALATGTAVNGNGVFNEGPGLVFPKSTFGANNYFVDVLFAEAPPPGQPTNVTATAGSESATVSWTAPTGGSPLTTYTVTPYVGPTALTPTTLTGSPPLTSTTISGLNDGTEYTFKVRASGINGAGAPSVASNGVTPLAPSVPSAPLGVSATAATGQALVSWSAPASTGGRPITGYRVTPYIGSAAQTSVAVGATASSATVGGLTDGTSYTFKVSAANANGPSAESAPSNEVMPLQTIFDLTAPTNADSGEGSPLEVGVKFTSEVTGYVTGVRFYKSAANTGTHVGSLWSAATKERLAKVTFTGETASGWQEMNFANAVEVHPGTVYVASYSAPAGHYSVTPNGFANAIGNGPLHALAGTSANGVFGNVGEFPEGTYGNNNYFVDVTFDESAPPGRVTKVSASPGYESATIAWSAPSGGPPVTGYEVIPYIGTTAQAPTTISGPQPATHATISGLSAGTEYTFKVQALSGTETLERSTGSNPVTPLAVSAPPAPTAVAATAATGQALVSWSPPSSNGGSAITGYKVTPYNGATPLPAVSVSATETSTAISGLSNGTAYTFTVAATNGIGTGSPSLASSPVTPERTIFDFASPATIETSESTSTEVGVKFTSSLYGSVTGIRFYKGKNNTGTHVGSLWTSSGTLLAEATFTSETPSGWQQVNFSKAVEITPGTVYVAAYLAPNGHYSTTTGAFATTGTTNGPLQALANGISPDGVYSLTATSAFPTSTLNSSNYFVDVLFAEAPAPGQVTNVTATAGLESAVVSWSAPTGGGPVTTYTITPYIGAVAQTPITVTGAPPLTSATVSGLKGATEYTFKVQASSVNGAGAQSAASATVTPSAFTETAQAGDGQVVLSWTGPPASATNPYTVLASPGSATCTSTSAATCTVTGLTDGQTYSFALTGAGKSASVSATPYPASVMSGSNGLSLWLDAADASTTYASSSCTGVSAQAGQVVGCWTDKSASAVNFTQPAAATAPSLGTLDGLHAISFTSSTQTQALSATASNTYQTVFIATQLAASPNGFDELFGQTNADFGIRHYPTSPGPLANPNENDWDVGTGAPVLEWTNGAQATEPVAGTPTVIVDQSSSAKTISATVGNYVLSRGMLGQIGEIVAFKGTLTAAQRESVQSYLARKWGATLPPTAAPAITTQPAGATVAEGKTATFSAAASGSPTPTVQWQVYATADAGWTNIPGATGTTYTTAATTATQNGYQYRAVFTNSAGSATTNAVVLGVTANVAPKVTTQPVSVSVTVGVTATFNAAASGVPAPTVQWQLSTNSGSTWTNISGATSTTYVSGVTSSIDNGYQYRAVFTNSAGSATSSVAVLTVTTPLAAPKVTTQPVSQTVAIFGTATFTAAASGNPTPTVQWQQSTNSGKTWSNISGATSTSYRVTSLFNNGYEFRAVFTNSQGSATTNAAKLTT